MALTKCPDCGADVSDRAPTCPRCGAPVAGRVEAMQTGTPLTTIQETSKRLKGQILIAALLFWGGLAFMFFSAAGRSGPPGPAAIMTSSLCVMTGFVWYIATRFRIWWHHK